MTSMKRLSLPNQAKPVKRSLLDTEPAVAKTANVAASGLLRRRRICRGGRCMTVVQKRFWT